VSEPDTQTQLEPDTPAVSEPATPPQVEPVLPAVSEPNTHAQLEPDASALSEPAITAVSEPGDGGTLPMSCTGDLNEDGIITPTDSLVAFQCYLRSGPCLVCTDVNQDDVVTPTDALCLFKKYLGVSSCLDMTAGADDAGLREGNEPFIFTGNEEQEQEGNFPEPVQTPWSIELFGHVNAEKGSWVLAYSPEDVLCGKAIVKKDGLYGILHVYMDNPGTKEKEGIVAGDSIFFQVNGKMATPLGPDKAIYEELSNDLIQINLEIE
jgi:hypothetical protein